jgi:L-lactate dehydrogenase complex protein LldG
VEEAVTATREEFLQRVRQAVAAGNRPGSAAPIPARGNLGYQGAGGDPVARFCEQLTAAGGVAHRVSDSEAAASRVVELVKDRSARKALVGWGPVVDALRLPERLGALGIEVIAENALSAADCKEPFFAADIGISGVDYLIAETGTVALLTKPQTTRSVSLLPPVHIAVAESAQVLPDLFDLFAKLPPEGSMPACVSLITGPSKTGDIELRLVTGVHGPGEIHVVIVGQAF